MIVDDVMRTVTASTEQRYRRALERLRHFCTVCDLPTATTAEIDHAVAAYTAAAARAGRPRSWAVNARVAIQKARGLARGELRLAAAVHRGVAAEDVRRRLRPIGRGLLLVLVGDLLARGDELARRVALGMLVMYGGTLRGKEVREVEARDVGILATDSSVATGGDQITRNVTLHRTKTLAHQRNRARNQRLEDEIAVVTGGLENLALERLRRDARARGGAATLLVGVSAGIWRRTIQDALDRACAATGLAREGLRPHGIRAGAATDAARRGAGPATLLARGRWTTAASLRMYLNAPDAMRTRKRVAIETTYTVRTRAVVRAWAAAEADRQGEFVVELTRAPTE